MTTAYYATAGGDLGTEPGANVNFAAVSVQAGARIDRYIWARADFLAGTADPARLAFCPVGAPCAGPPGGIYQLRAGFEARGCAINDVVCWFGGIDAGYSHSKLMGIASTNEAVVLPRAGLDIGTHHVRFRVAFELGWDGARSGAGGLDAGLGYRW